MMPPTRIEQLNNFQDAVQSPDGLDRLRALQAVEQALPSSQGLMGMPQVQAPMPMVPRQYGGEIGTGGLVDILDDGTQVFDSSQEGILNRSLHGGIMQGFTPSTSQPPSNQNITNVEQTKVGPYNLSDYSNLNLPETIKMESSPQTSFRSPSGKIPYDLYVPPAVTTFAQGYDMKDVPYVVANKMAQDAGADRFIYNEQYARTENLPDDYDYSRFGTQVYKPSILRPNVDYSSALLHGYTQHNLPAPNPESEYAKAAQGLFKNPYSGAYEYSGKGTSGSPFVTRKDVQLDYYGRPMKEGGQIISKQYGGEIGTGGLVDILDDGTQVFSNTEEGILNRSLHGGMLQGQTQTATAPSSFSGGTDAAGTLASGTSAAPAVLPKTAVDSSFLSPVMQLDNVQQRGGIYNASDIRDAGITLSRPSDAPETIISSGGAQTKYRDPRTGKIPYDLYVPQPVNTFGQGYDLKDMDYFTANALALSEGADRFMYNNEYAAVDPGLLSNYDYSNLGTKPYAAPVGPIEGVSYSGVSTGRGGNYANLPQNPNSPAAMRAKGYIYPGRGLPPVYVGIQNTPVRYREGGGQVDPSQAAQGLASFGRYGDNILVHMNPEELQGLASLGQITYNPVTGLPEAFSLKGLFKGIRKLAPVAMAFAAPMLLGPGGLGLFSKGFLASTAGAATAGGIGGFFGNLIAGAKPKDALKAGLTSAVMAGGAAALSGAPLTGGAAKGTGQMAAMSPGSASLKASLGVPKTGMSGYGQGLAGGSEFTPAITKNIATGGDSLGRGFGFKPGDSFKLAQQSLPNANLEVMQNPNLIDSAQLNIQRQVPTYGSVKPAQIMPAEQAGGFQNVMDSPLVQDTTGTLKNIGSQIGDQLSTRKGIAKAVGIDLMTPDWEAKYAAEAAAKEQQLQDAGYTVETGFNGQTVIRDSSGVQMPRTLTVQQILDRALGKAPRSKMVADYRYGPSKAKGGLISLKHGGEFSGMVPGEGHGMEDNVYMPITEGPKQVGTLAVSPSEYVVDSYTMAALGNGNADAGAKVMDRVVKHVRKKAYGDIEQPNEISGLEALKPMMERV